MSTLTRFTLAGLAVALVAGVVHIVADGPTRALLADADLLRAHALELPYGFDPRALDAEKLRQGRNPVPPTVVVLHK